MSHWGPVDTIQDLVNKMGGETNIDRFLSGELVLVEKSNLKAVVTEVRDFAIWKTVTLGLKKSPKGYLEALKRDGYCIGDYAGQILHNTGVSQTKVEVDLVVVTVGELGFNNSARRDKIYARAIELGFRLCPAEVGPALRLAYKDQPKGECLRIGMEPITVWDSPDVFGVDNENDERCLNSFYGNADSYWRADGRWVFVCPRK